MHKAKTRKYLILTPPVSIQILDTKLFQILYFAHVFNLLQRFGNMSFESSTHQTASLR
jgi:hypothetical protein